MESNLSSSLFFFRKIPQSSQCSHPVLHGSVHTLCKCKSAHALHTFEAQRACLSLGSMQTDWCATRYIPSCSSGRRCKPSVRLSPRKRGPVQCILFVSCVNSLLRARQLCQVFGRGAEKSQLGGVKSAPQERSGAGMMPITDRDPL